MDQTRFAEVLGRAKAGDDGAFAELWRWLNPALVRYLRVMVGGDDVDDVASTTWMDVVRAMARFPSDVDGFRAWLFTVARRRVLDFHRAQGRQPALVDAELVDAPIAAGQDPAELAEQSWSTDAALDLIGSLSADQAEVLILRVVADFDVATVARIVGKRPGAVRALAHRGLRQLAKGYETPKIADYP
jgi:RNA polymerase sigma-70 factor (ECF subfamily)